MSTFTRKREREGERGESTREKRPNRLRVVFLWSTDHFSERLSMLCSYLLAEGHPRFPPSPNSRSSKGFLTCQAAIFMYRSELSVPYVVPVIWTVVPSSRVLISLLSSVAFTEAQFPVLPGGNEPSP